MIGMIESGNGTYLFHGIAAICKKYRIGTPHLHTAYDNIHRFPLFRSGWIQITDKGIRKTCSGKQYCKREDGKEFYNIMLFHFLPAFLNDSKEILLY